MSAMLPGGSARANASPATHSASRALGCRTAIEVVESVYQLAGDDQAWLQHVADAAAPEPDRSICESSTMWMEECSTRSGAPSRAGRAMHYEGSSTRACASSRRWASYPATIRACAAPSPRSSGV